MCICAKIDAVAAQALQYLRNDDHAIVIGLQSTGEAGMEVALEELAITAAESAGRRGDASKIDFEDMSLSGLVSTCASVMSNFVRNHFPVALPPPDVPKVPSIPPGGFASEADRLEHARLTDVADRMKNEPPPEPIPELVDRRNKLLESINYLDLPPNPLDDIIDRLGGVENVAEMTGRTGRVLRNKSGKYKYVKRFGGPSKQKSYGLSIPVSAEDDNDRLNIIERRSWMNGKKSVAIISDAASTGISLHADSRCKSSHKRRVHFTIEVNASFCPINPCFVYHLRLLFTYSQFLSSTSFLGPPTKLFNNWGDPIELARRLLPFTKWSSPTLEENGDLRRLSLREWLRSGLSPRETVVLQQAPIYLTLILIACSENGH